MKYGDEALPAAFWAKVSPEPNSGCWLWTGRASNQYGTWTPTRGGRQEYVHRTTCTLERGPIQRGHHTDHLCRVTICCNPDHLEAVPPKINAQRGLRGGLRTHCKHGHEYTPENTWRHADGNRFCRTCKNKTNKERYMRPEVKAQARARRHERMRQVTP